MPSKIRIKVGEVEIEYEGEEQFLKQELTGLLTAVAELHNAVGAPIKKHLQQPLRNLIRLPPQI